MSDTERKFDPLNFTIDDLNDEIKRYTQQHKQKAMQQFTDSEVYFVKHPDQVAAQARALQIQLTDSKGRGYEVWPNPNLEYLNGFVLDNALSLIRGRPDLCYMVLVGKLTTRRGVMQPIQEVGEMLEFKDFKVKVVLAVMAGKASSHSRHTMLVITQAGRKHSAPASTPAAPQSAQSAQTPAQPDSQHRAAS